MLVRFKINDNDDYVLISEFNRKFYVFDSKFKKKENHGLSGLSLDFFEK